MSHLCFSPRLRAVLSRSQELGCHGWLAQHCLGLGVCLSVLVLASVGCLHQGPEKIQPIDVDPASVAASAIELYDANHDGSLDLAELAQSPAMASWFSPPDASGSDLSRDDLAERLRGMFAGTSLIGVECQVLLDGRPLRQATVRLVPAEILGDSLQPAEGVTDESGTARPTVASEHLPQNLQGSPLMMPGLYRVEITHPQASLPSRYNSASELGMAVDPSGRGGTAATFRLKSK